MSQKVYQKVIQSLLNQGADYAEVSFIHSYNESLSNIDNKRFNPNYSESKGVSIRAIINKVVFFESTTNDSEENLLSIATELLDEAKKDVDFEFNKVDIYGEFDYQKLDYEATKQLISHNVEKALSYGKKTSSASSNLVTNTQFKKIATSDGNYVEFVNYVSTLSTSIIAKKGDDQQSTSARFSKSLEWRAFFQEIKKHDFDAELMEKAKLANELLDAPQISGGNMPVILPHGFGAVLFHEAVGHPLEATAVAKGLSTFANKKGQQIASTLVTLVDDGTIVGETGTSKYDDEGQPQQRRVLIENGILKNFLVDKFNGMLLGKEANGAARRQSFSHIPTSRMSNTFILNGKQNVVDIIASTKEGFYAKELGGGQVDPFTGQFNFGVSIGYVIKDGKISHLVKPATLIGNGQEALMKVDAIANDFTIDPGTCGSSSGMIPVTVGQPTLRVSNMTVGGK